MTSPSSTLGPPLWHAVNMVGSTLFESTPLLMRRNPPLIRNRGGACRMGEGLTDHASQSGRHHSSSTGNATSASYPGPRATNLSGVPSPG